MRCPTSHWASTLLLVALTALPMAAADDDIRLTGCLVRGEDGGGYMVTNALGEAAWQRAADATVVPGPVGTSGTVSSIFYWLEERNGLDLYSGRLIELDGTFQDNLTEGRIEITPNEQWADIKIESYGKSMNAQVPKSALVGTIDRTIDVLVRRVVPQRIRILAPACRR